MNINHSDLRKIYRAYLHEKRSSFHEECPSSEEILSLFSRTRSGESKNRLMDHIFGCNDCLEKFDFILGIQKNKKELEDSLKISLRDVSVATSRYSSRLIWEYVLNSLGILIFSISLWLTFSSLQTPEKDKAIFRTKEVGFIVPLRPRGNILVADNLLFEWKGDGKTISYFLEIYDDSLTLIWKSPSISGTRLFLPAAVLNNLHAGRTYFWMISANLENSGIVNSELFNFMLSKGQ